eukprot:scaffold26400_cov18-Tisochrysis_lutea.AAC.2
MDGSVGDPWSVAITMTACAATLDKHCGIPGCVLNLHQVVSAQGSRFSGWLSKKSHNKMVRGAGEGAQHAIISDPAGQPDNRHQCL